MNDESAMLGAERRLALPGGGGAGPRRWLVAGLIAALIGVGALIWWATRPAKIAASSGDQLQSITVGVPGRSVVDHIVTATGSIAARREMPVGVAGEGGMVTRVLVEPGQWVAAGQVLATVDRSVQTQTTASLAAQVNVAKADAAIAQSELDRAQSLVAQGFVSKADLERKAATRDAAAARVRVAQAALAEQQARTGRLDIRAPAAGLILTRGVEPGQIVASGSGVLFRMAKGGEMELRAQLTENDLASLHVGAPATVKPVGGAASFAGEVWQVSPVIDPQSRQGIARIALKYDPALRPGGFAAATIRSGSASVPQLPNAAIQSDERGSYVYIADAGDKVVRRDVKTGDVSDTGVTIVQGLNGTERVILQAGAFVTPGQKIRPILAKPQG